jgi:enamine deaminase RidA (YjgF/YER057c/UK114 family)
MTNCPHSAPDVHEPLVTLRRVSSPAAIELFINIGVEAQAEGDPAALQSAYARLGDMLKEHGARIFHERLFTNSGDMGAIDAMRIAALGDERDGVGPTVLIAPPGGSMACGLQVHAVCGDARMDVVSHDGAPVGRSLSVGDRTWVHLSGLTADPDDTPFRQARLVYERAADILRACDMNLRHVARTWVWLHDILSWYDAFNAARTAVYQREGIVNGDGEALHLPASTGMGIAPANRAACALEVYAISDGRDCIRTADESRTQNSAFSYGSAFARAAIVPGPAGRTLLVSGTADINTRGESEHEGDIRAQIGATVRNIRSLVSDADMTDQHVVSATSYCKTPEVARIFAGEWSDLPWPRVEIIGDVCRDELLFEMEATAAASDV